MNAGRPSIICQLPRTLLVALPLLVATTACGSNKTDKCQPGDEDGVTGGMNTVLLSVSDSAFAVGGVGSGSTQRNITVQNSSQVNLTLTNEGTRPHSLVVQCIPSGLPAGCAQTSCFPTAANLAALDPGASVTATFTVPAVEGTYPFASDAPGDEDSDGNATLVGEYILN
jgi:hypothetical protein